MELRWRLKVFMSECCAVNIQTIFLNKTSFHSAFFRLNIFFARKSQIKRDVINLFCNLFPRKNESVLPKMSYKSLKFVWRIWEFLSFRFVFLSLFGTAFVISIREWVSKVVWATLLTLLFHQSKICFVPSVFIRSPLCAVQLCSG